MKSPSLRGGRCGGGLQISSDEYDQRIFLCLKFLIPGFFFGGGGGYS